jgi:predicted kinase
MPFSGKSTLARAMAERFDLEHIEIDQVHGERGFEPGSGRQMGDADWRAAFQRSFRRLHGVLAEGQPAVWDTASYRKAQRERIRGVASRYGGQSYLVHLATPETEARSRLERNRETGERRDVPDESFFEVARDFEMPGPDEAPIHYSPDVPIDRWLEETIAPLIEREGADKEQTK